MQIIDPQIELWQQSDPIAHVAHCARICYGKKEGKSTDQQLYDNLIKSGHLSVLRHESVYAIVRNRREEDEELIFALFHIPYVEIRETDETLYIATNKNYLLDMRGTAFSYFLKEWQVTPEEFNNTEVGHSMMRYTFHITTQISTSRELNRVSPNSITERSTRYCLEDGVIVRPHWLDIDIANEFNNNPSVDMFEYNHPELENEIEYFKSCKDSFRRYRNMIGRGMKRQDARGILPLDTVTEVVYTYSVDEWRHIIELRTSPRAHPNAQIIANMIKEQLKQLDYD